MSDLASKLVFNRGFKVDRTRHNEGINHGAGADSAARGSVAMNDLTKAQRELLIEVCAQPPAMGLPVSGGKLRTAKSLEKLGLVWLTTNPMGTIINPTGAGRAEKTWLDERRSR